MKTSFKTFSKASVLQIIMWMVSASADTRCRKNMRISYFLFTFSDKLFQLAGDITLKPKYLIQAIHNFMGEVDPNWTPPKEHEKYVSIFF